MPRLLVARLHALGKRNLLLCREQRHMADLLEIHADRVVKRDSLGDGEVDLDFFFLLGRLLLGGLPRCRRIVDNLDALAAEALVHIVHLVGGHILFLQGVNELAVGQCAAVLLALGKKAFNDVGARRRLLLRPLCHNAVLLSFIRKANRCLKDQNSPVVCAGARGA